MKACQCETPVVTMPFQTWARIKKLIDCAAMGNTEADDLEKLAKKINLGTVPTTPICWVCDENPGTIKHSGRMICGECATHGGAA